MRQYIFKPMTLKYAEAIRKWKYQGYMKSIFMDPYFENIEDGEALTGPGGCDGFAVFYAKELFGLFEYYHLNDDTIEIGLAINPKYVGQNLSKEYIYAGLKFCKKRYDYQKDIIKLTVDVKNLSAYYAYQKAGFKEISRNDEEIAMIFKLKNLKEAVD